MEQKWIDWAEGHGWRVYGEETLCGVWDGMPFKLEPNHEEELELSFQLDGIIQLEPLAAQYGVLDERVQVTCNNKAKVLTVVFTQNEDQDAPEPMLVESTLRQIVPALAMVGLRVPQKCAVCGKGECDAYALADAYVPVHAHCCEAPSGSGNLMLGLVGALIGAIVGMIPNILTIFLLERIFAVAYALIPLGAVCGYNLLKGPKHKLVLPVVIVLSILVLFLQEVVVFHIALLQAYGPIMTFMESVMLFFEGETLVGLIRSMGSSFVFLALGIWIAFTRLRQMTQSDPARMARLHDTLIRR